MVTVSTATAEDPVDMAQPALVDFQGFPTFDPHFYGWISPMPGSVAIYGSGFTYSGVGDEREMTGGSINSISIDAGADNVTLGAGDLVFGDTGALNGAAIDKDDPQSFWNEVLKGDDTFDLTGLDEDLISETGQSIIFADDLDAARGAPTVVSDRGGKDIIHAGDNAFYLVGDVMNVIGAAGPTQFARYAGGRDRMDSGGLAAGATDRPVQMAGDAGLVREFALLKGGDDRLSYLGFSGNADVGGDAFQLVSGRVNGGDDTIVIDYAIVPVSNAQVGGDVWMFGGGGAVLAGGDDLIRIAGGRGVVGGDVYIIEADSFGSITGGDDQITGSSEDDTLCGELGFSAYAPGVSVIGGDDLVSGGAGNDTLYGEGPLSAGALSGGDDTLFGGRGHDTMIGQTGDDRLFGDDGKDNLVGEEGGDVLNGGLDLDKLFGDEGSDTLIGGGGADFIRGGVGADRLTGGADRDSFEYEAIDDSGPTAGARDRITDFTHLADRIHLGDIDAEAGGADDAFKYIGSAAFSKAGQVRATQVNADTLVEMNTEGPGGAEMSILLLNFTASTLTAADFVL